MRAIDLVLNNWEVIIGLILWAVHLLVKLKVVNAEKVELLYEEAVRFAEQWKKAQGKSGMTPTSQQMQDKAIEYLSDRIPILHVIDLHKLDAAVNLYNSLR